MSEKITFRELIDSIADKTDNSKQFTHDFLKDFADVINEGLEEDGKVNIAGFGKFGLRRLDERRGYNPQTGESMTIPEHNKVIFKPYKDLRELVNAPYSHMESKIIEEDKNTEKEVKKGEEEQQKDIPITPIPPANQEKNPEDDTNDEQEEHFFDNQDKKETSSTFSFDEETDESETGIEKENDDIVEFKQGQETVDEELDDFMSEFTSGENKQKYMPPGTDDESGKDEPEPMENDPAVFSSAESENNANSDFDSIIEDEPIPQTDSPSKPGKKNNRNRYPFLVAAAVILLLLVAGSGYMLMQTQQDNENDPTRESAAAIIKQNVDNNADQQAQPQNEEQQVDQPQQTQNSNQQTSQPAENRSVELEINSGQTLWGMAESEYDNPYLWPWIYDANKSSIDNPDLIIAGQTLTVPVPSGVQNSLSSADSVEVAIGYVETYKWYKDEGRDNARLYLWVAANYDEDVLKKTDINVDKDDLAFANRSQVY